MALFAAVAAGGQRKGLAPAGPKRITTTSVLDSAPDDLPSQHWCVGRMEEWTLVNPSSYRRLFRIAPGLGGTKAISKSESPLVGCRPFGVGSCNTGCCRPHPKKSLPGLVRFRGPCRGGSSGQHTGIVGPLWGPAASNGRRQRRGARLNFSKAEAGGKEEDGKEVGQKQTLHHVCDGPFGRAPDLLYLPVSGQLPWRQREICQLPRPP